MDPVFTSSVVVVCVMFYSRFDSRGRSEGGVEKKEKIKRSRDVGIPSFNIIHQTAQQQLSIFGWGAVQVHSDIFLQFLIRSVNLQRLFFSDER